MGKTAAPARCALALILTGVPAAADITAYFSPQSSDGDLTLYLITICSTDTTDSPPFSGGLIYAAAQSRISPLSRAVVESRFRHRAGRSPWRITASIVEGVLVAGTVVDLTKEGGRIRENYKLAAPVAAALLRITTTAIRPALEPPAIPDDYLPPFIQIPRSGCVQHTLYARTQDPEPAFEVRVR